MKLDIPFYRQQNEFTCGPASLQMVLAFLGTYKSQRALAKEAKTTKEGTRHHDMIEVARKKHFFSYVNDNSTVKEIKHFIGSGLPVIVNYQEPKDNEGHYAVVSGYGKKNLILHDPWNGKNFRLSEKEFMSRWHDRQGTHTYKKWMMVLSKNDFNLGKDYRPL